MIRTIGIKNTADSENESAVSLFCALSFKSDSGAIKVLFGGGPGERFFVHEKGSPGLSHPINAVISYGEHIYVAVLRLPPKAVLIGRTHIRVAENAGALYITSVGSHGIAVNVCAIL